MISKISVKYISPFELSVPIFSIDIFNTSPFTIIMPLLNSFINNCSSLQSFCSTILSKLPFSSFTILPYPNGSSISLVRTVATEFCCSWKSKNFFSVSCFINGVSPVKIITLSSVFISSKHNLTAYPVPYGYCSPIFCFTR